MTWDNRPSYNPKYISFHLHPEIGKIIHILINGKQWADMKHFGEINDIILIMLLSTKVLLGACYLLPS